MRLNPVLIIAAIFSIFSHHLFAAPCESNFVSGGNFITGSIYKTYADLPNTNAINAFDGALADIVKHPAGKYWRKIKPMALYKPFRQTLTTKMAK